MSWLQSRVLSDWADEIDYWREDGPADRPVLAPAGPYDMRLGYSRLPEIVANLERQGFEVVAQARGSDVLHRSVERGLFPIYEEKTRAGLRIGDRSGRVLFRARYPGSVYPTFESIPESVVRTLLFIENRELLEPPTPSANPAVEWDRLAGSVVKLIGSQLRIGASVPGGSTLATQIEKFRHSPDGVTRSPGDKLQQIATASVRAYRLGTETTETRRRIVLDYLNSVPLAAVGGHGEVIGLLDGLRAWYGLDPERITWLLLGCPEDRITRPSGPASFARGRRYACVASPTSAADPDLVAERGAALRAVLQLMLAQRRPGYYLVRAEGHDDLELLADAYLNLLERAGELRPDLIASARVARVARAQGAPPTTPLSFVERKASTSARTHLLRLTGVDRLYELDRLDLDVASTIDAPVQDSVTALLRRLEDPAFVQREGLTAGRLIGSGDPEKIVYSFVLYELAPGGAVVRVQTDNFEGPFDLNASSRLELGSTAKLRALVTYLEIVERLHHELTPLDGAERAALADSLPDPLTLWAVRTLAERPGIELDAMLEAGMDRMYSANPSERFFTGGGSHTFGNFDNTFDGRTLTVRAGFRHSVNLVFVRLMRDIERFYRWRVPGASANILRDPTDPRRGPYLERFVDREGRIFVSRFDSKFRGKTGSEILDALVEGRRMTPQRLARVYRSVRPDDDFAAFSAFLTTHSTNTSFDGAALQALYYRSAVQHLSIADQGYLASVHPLELWVARHLIADPEATRQAVQEESAQARRDVYGWLFDPRRQREQDRSISVMQEIEAFLEIQRAWERVGYPFQNLVPSLGTSIGSSGDRPGALGDLVGIILNEGVRLPVRPVSQLRFATSTPYETSLVATPSEGERVLSRQVAQTAKTALLDVVEEGTARTIRGAVRDARGVALPIGGKTGTGDNRARVLSSTGQLLETRVLNRTATFVFFIGDRHYGVITVHVPGRDAAEFRFTSALAVRVLSLITPYLSPLLTG